MKEKLSGVLSKKDMLLNSTSTTPPETHSKSNQLNVIHNKETGVDNWYLLISQNTEQGTQYFTNEFE